MSDIFLRGKARSRKSLAPVFTECVAYQGSQLVRLAGIKCHTMNTGLGLYSMQRPGGAESFQGGDMWAESCRDPRERRPLGRGNGQSWARDEGEGIQCGRAQTVTGP